MGLVWVACAVLLDMNASYGPCHPTISRCWLRRTNFLESVLGPPLSLFSASQQMHGAHHLFAHMQSHMSVKTQEDPLNLHIFNLDVLVMKNKSNKDLRWPLLELLRVVRFYLEFNPRCTSRGFNYHSIFLHDTTWMLDVPRVSKRRKNPTKSSVVLSD